MVQSLPFLALIQVYVCFFGRGKGKAPHRHKDSYSDLNLKILISEWDSNPRPHEYGKKTASLAQYMVCVTIATKCVLFLTGKPFSWGALYMHTVEANT